MKKTTGLHGNDLAFTYLILGHFTYQEEKTGTIIKS